MKIINLAAGPGAGKSTNAAGLFYIMKSANYKVELVNEYAKEMTYENRENILGDQLYILAKQNRKLERLKGQVDYVITDSPLFLSLAYVKDCYHKSFCPLVIELFNSYNNINFFINRKKQYQKYGRTQTLGEAIDKDYSVKELMNKYNISHIEIDGNEHAPQIMLTHILNA